MTPGLYSHPSCTEVYFRVGAISESENCYTFVVRYWNRHYGFYQGKTQLVTLSKENAKKWRKL